MNRDSDTEIKELLKAYGITQKRFSEITGIPLRTVEDWSRGACHPPEYVIRFIRFYLDANRK